MKITELDNVIWVFYSDSIQFSSTTIKIMVIIKKMKKKNWKQEAVVWNDFEGRAWRGKHSQSQGDKKLWSGEHVWRWIAAFTAGDMQVNASWHTCSKHWQRGLERGRFPPSSSSKRSALSGHSFLLSLPEKTLEIPSQIKTNSLRRCFFSFFFC